MTQGGGGEREDEEFMNFAFSCSLIPRGMVKCRCMRKALCARSQITKMRKDEENYEEISLIAPGSNDGSELGRCPGKGGGFFGQ